MLTDTARGVPPPKSRSSAQNARGGIYRPQDSISDAPDWRELRLLAALLASERARTEIGLLATGPGVFTEAGARVVARWALTTNAAGNPPSHVAEALAALGPMIWVYVGSLNDASGTLVDAWAVRDVRHYASDLARSWLPANLRWCADGLERGEPFDAISLYLRRTLELTDPTPSLVEGRAAA